MPRLRMRPCPTCEGECTVPTCLRHGGGCPCRTVQVTCPECGGHGEVEDECGECGEALLADDPEGICEACLESMTQERQQAQEVAR